MAISGKNMSDLKASNRRAILNTLHEEGGMSRKQLAARLSLTPAAITVIVNDLIGESILREVMTMPKSGSAGRKEIIVDINGMEFLAAGVSFNIGETLISVLNLRGDPIFTSSLSVSPDLSAKESIDYAILALKQALLEKNIPLEKIIGLGVSVRGIVDGEGGICENSLGLWKELRVPVRRYFEEQFAFPVTLDNHVRALANAQLFFAKDSAAEVSMFIRSETGIGAALIINHKLFSGSANRSAEIGHVVVVPDGAHCSCGNRGCLETVASYAGIINEARRVYGAKTTPILFKLTGGCRENVTLELFISAVEQKDAAACVVFQTAVESFADVVKTAIKLLDLQKVIFYGRLFNNAFYMSELKKQLIKDGDFINPETLFEKSAMNQQLDSKAGALLAVKSFFTRGAAGFNQNNHQELY